MLSGHLVRGSYILGLFPLLMQRPDAVGASYRVVRMGGVAMVEFFGRPSGPGAGSTNITTLPYFPGRINNTEMTGTEVISGEFNGCIMAMYRDAANTQRCAHVCTQSGVSQRDAWNTGVGDGTYSDVQQLDTVGMVADYVGATVNTFVLCVADPGTNTIFHAFVERENHQFGTGVNLRTEKRYRVTSVG